MREYWQLIKAILLAFTLWKVSTWAIWRYLLKEDPEPDYRKSLKKALLGGL